MEQRRLLTVAATLTGTQLAVSITGADTAAVTSDPVTHDVKVNGADPTGGPSLSSSVTSIMVTPDGTASDTVDLTGVGTSSDFSGLATITVNGGAATGVTMAGTYDTTGVQTYDDPVTLTADTLLTGSAVTFAGTVDSDAVTARSLTVFSPLTTFEGEVGTALPNALNALTTAGTVALPGSGATDINTDKVKAATLDFKNAVTLTANTALTATTSATFESTVDSDALATPRDLTVNSPATTFMGRLGDTFPLGTLIVDGIPTGTGVTDLNTDVVQATAIDFKNPVVLTADVTVTGATSVTFEKTVDSDAVTARSLTVFSPLTKFEGEVGFAHPLNVLTADGTTTGSGATDVNTDVVKVAALDFKNAVILTTAPTTPITLTATTSATFESTVDSDALATPRDLTVDSPTTKFEGRLGGTFALGALLTDGIPTGTGTTDINTDVVKAASMDFKNAVVLTADATLTASSAAITPAPLTFEKTVDSDTVSARSLTTKSILTVFKGEVGFAHALNVLTTDGTTTGMGTTNINADVVTAATLDFKNPVQITVPTTTLTGTATATFEKTLDSDGTAARSVTVFSPLTTFDGEVGSALPNALNALTTAGTVALPGSGATDINTDKVNAATLDFKNAVQITVPTTTLTGTATATFEKTLDSDGVAARSVTVYSPLTTFAGEVGTALPNALNVLTTAGTVALPASGTTDINTDKVVAAVLDFKNAVKLTANTTLTGTTSVTFESTVDSDALATPRDLTVISPTAKFEGAIGGTFPLGALTVDGTTTGTGATDINTGVVQAAAVDFKNPVTLTADVTVTSTTSVTFEKTVDSDALMARSLTVFSPLTAFMGEVGTALPNALNVLTTAGTVALPTSGTTDINTDKVNAATMDFKNAVVVTADATLTATAPPTLPIPFPLNFESTVNSDTVSTRSLTAKSMLTRFAGEVGAAHPLNVLTTDGTTTGMGTTNINTDVVTAATLDFKNAVQITVPTTTLTGTATATFETTLDSDATAARSVTVYSPLTTFKGEVGTALPNALNMLTTAGSVALPASGTTDINTDKVKAATFDFKNAVTLTAPGGVATATTLTATTSAKFESTVDSDALATPRNLTVISPIVMFQGPIGNTFPLGTLIVDGTTTGTGVTDVNTGVVQAAAIDFMNPVVLTSDVTITGTTSVTFVKTVDSDAVAARSLTVYSPLTTFEGKVGTAVPNALNKLITAGTVALPGSGTTNINTDTVTAAVLDFRNAVLITVPTAPAPVTLKGTTSATFERTLDSGAPAQSVTVLSPLTAFDGEVGNASALNVLTTDGTATGTGTTDINTDVVKASTIDFKNPVLLTADATLTASSAVLTPAPLTFEMTLDSDSVSARSLTTKSILTLFKGEVGFAHPLNVLTTDGTTTGTGTTDINTDVVKAAVLDFKNAVQITVPTTTLTGTATATFETTLDSDATAARSVTVYSPLTTFKGEVGTALPNALNMLTTAGSVALPASGTTDINTDKVNAAVLDFRNAVEITAPATTLKAATSATFERTLDSDFLATPRTLTVIASTTFDGAVGAVFPLQSLTVTGAADLNGGAVNTTGGQTYTGAVTLSANTTLTSTNMPTPGNITFGSTVDGDGNGPWNLTVDTTGGQPAGSFGNVTFGGAVGTTKPLASLTVAEGGMLTIAHDITTNGNILLTVAEGAPNNAPVDNLVAGSATIKSTNGTIELRAGDNVTLDPSSTLTATAGSVTIRGDYQNNDTPAGTVINLDGVIHSPTITVYGGPGNDTINLEQTQSGTSTTVYPGAGVNTIDISSTASTSPAGGVLNMIQGAVTINGGGNDTLNLGDAGDAATAIGTFSAVPGHPSTVTRFGMGPGITYFGIADLNVTLGSGAASSYAILGTPSGTKLSALANSNAGTSDYFFIGRLAGGSDSILGPVVVTGGAGAETVDVGNTAESLDDIRATIDISRLAGSSNVLTVNDKNAALLSGHRYDVTANSISRDNGPQPLVVYAVSTQAAQFQRVDLEAVQQPTADNVVAVHLPSLATQALVTDGGNANCAIFQTLGDDTSPSAATDNNVDAVNVGDPTVAPSPLGQELLAKVANYHVLFMVGAETHPNKLLDNSAIGAFIIGQSPPTFNPSALPDTLQGNGVSTNIILGGDANLTNISGAGPTGIVIPNVGAQPSVDGMGIVAPLFFYPSSIRQVTGGSGQVFVPPGVQPLLDTIGWLTQQVTTTGAVPTVDQLNQFFACLNEASDPADPPGVAPAPPISAAAAQAYVNAVYQGLLGRAPDAGGASYWAAALVAATSRATFTNALAHSDEFYRVKVIETAYSRYLHRAPDAAGLQYWTSQMQAGLTDAQLEAGFIASSEFASVAAALHPMLSANDAVITELYSDLLGRSPDTAGESFWVGKLNTGATLYNVALGFTASPEREGQTIQSADYQGLLGRTASPAEIAAWVGLYEQGQTNEDIQAMFAATDEFFNSHS